MRQNIRKPTKKRQVGRVKATEIIGAEPSEPMLQRCVMQTLGKINHERNKECLMPHTWLRQDTVPQERRPRGLRNRGGEYTSVALVEVGDFFFDRSDPDLGTAALGAGSTAFALACVREGGNVCGKGKGTTRQNLVRPPIQPPAAGTAGKVRLIVLGLGMPRTMQKKRKTEVFGGARRVEGGHDHRPQHTSAWGR